MSRAWGLANPPKPEAPPNSKPQTRHIEVWEKKVSGIRGGGGAGKPPKPSDLAVG